MITCTWCQQTMTGDEDARCVSHGICRRCMERIEAEFEECCGGCPLPEVVEIGGEAGGA